MVPYFPDLRVLIILHSANLPWFIRIPSESVHYRLVYKFTDRHIRLPNVQKLDAVTLKADHRE
jgi:hypothetical protein